MCHKVGWEPRQQTLRPNAENCSLTFKSCVWFFYTHATSWREWKLWKRNNLWGHREIGAAEMSRGLWVVEGATKVNASEVANGAVFAGQAATQIARARGLMSVGYGAHPSTFGATSSPDFYANPLAVHYLALLDEVRPVIAQASVLADALRGSLTDFSGWLGQAALIYASAEQGAQGMVDTCNILRPLGCSPPRKPESWAGWAGMIGRYVGDFTEKRDRPPTLNLHGQAQMETTAQFLYPRSPQALTEAAAKVGLAWGAIGTLFNPRGLGVVVMGEDGKAVLAAEPLWSLGLRRTLNPASTHNSSPKLAATIGRLTALQVEAKIRARFPTYDAPRVEVPLTGAALLGRVEQSRLGGSAGQVQILKHTNPKGDTSWSVVVRGTQEWKPGSANPQDMESNLQVVAGQTSHQQLSVEAAMEMAGIKPWEPVEMVGHSQGGAIALSIATSAAASKKFNFVSVLTAGAPTGTTKPPGNLSVLNVENLRDAVPALDGAAAPAGPKTVTAYFDANKTKTKKGEHAHAVDTYTGALEKMENENSALTKPIDDWGERRRAALGLEKSTKTEAIYFNTSRVQ